MKIDIIYVLDALDKTIESFNHIEDFEKFVIGVLKNELYFPEIKRYLLDKEHQKYVKNDANFAKHWIQFLAGHLRKKHLKIQILMEI